jgi:conjugative transposon TraK protein
MIFQHLKNIDTAFQYVRVLSLAVLVGSCLVSGYAVHQSYQMVRNVQEKIYILSNDMVIEATASSRKDNVGVEARGHIEAFHYFFFNLDPDEKMIEGSITKALYLADRSAKQQYDNLRENRYYSNLISGNITQQIRTDSIQVDIKKYPYYFRYYGTQKIIRTSSIVYRLLITEGYLRNTSTRTDHNRHGFLIEKWNTLENKNIRIENR